MMIFYLSSFSPFSVSFIIYIGLCFTSKYVFDRYCPIIPKENNCTPLTKNIIHTIDGHPDVGSPNTSVFMIITTINKNDIMQKSSTQTLKSTSEVKSASIEKIQPHTGYYLEETYVEENQYVEEGANIIKYTNGEYLVAPYDCYITELELPNTDE